MLREARKFLDLDMVSQAILDEGDRSLLDEAIQCYQIGSHRASVILAWCATADCLRRHILELAAEGDTQAQQAQAELKLLEGQSSYEEKLIVSARKCELIDDYDDKSLRFARDTRSQCAHPTGVIPSAEAVRHIIFICTQCVLNRRGYRGMSFVADVVTTQFDDRHFLPEEKKLRDHCRAIFEKVPTRLWPQFARIAAQKRPGPQSDVWQGNATAFFRALISRSEDQTAKQIASALQGFEPMAPDFFAALVGIDPRVTKFWDEQKRAQARARLIAASAVKITPDIVHSWAMICAADGFLEADCNLLRQKLGSIAKYLATEEPILVNRRDDLLQLLQEMLLDDATADQAAIALPHLMASKLFESGSDALQVIVESAIERFSRDERYRRIVEKVSESSTAFLIGFLEEAELFLNECADENADDVLILFEAAGELGRRAPIEAPPSFSEALNRVLKKEILPQWSVSTSEVGRAFHTQLSLLLRQHQATFPTIDGSLIMAFDDDDENDDSAAPAGENA
jgi:hypothetical protein